MLANLWQSSLQQTPTFTGLVGDILERQDLGSLSSPDSYVYLTSNTTDLVRGHSDRLFGTNGFETSIKHCRLYMNHTKQPQLMCLNNPLLAAPNNYTLRDFRSQGQSDHNGLGFYLRSQQNRTVTLGFTDAKFFLLGSTEPGVVFFLHTELIGNKTSIQMAMYDTNSSSIRYSQFLRDVLTVPGAFLINEHTKLFYYGLTKSLQLFNPQVLTNGIATGAPNNLLLSIDLKDFGTVKAYLTEIKFLDAMNSSRNFDPKHIYDVVQFNNGYLYIAGYEQFNSTHGKPVVMRLSSLIINNAHIFEATLLDRKYPIHSSIDYVSNRNFYFFVTSTTNPPDASLFDVALFLLEADPAMPLAQPIRYLYLDPVGKPGDIETKAQFRMPYQPNLDLKTRFLNPLSNNFQLNYYLNGSLLFVDYISGAGTGLNLSDRRFFLHRHPINDCDDVFVFANDTTEELLGNGFAQNRSSPIPAYCHKENVLLTFYITGISSIVFRAPAVLQTRTNHPVNIARFSAYSNETFQVYNEERLEMVTVLNILKPITCNPLSQAKYRKNVTDIVLPIDIGIQTHGFSGSDVRLRTVGQAPPEMFFYSLKDMIVRFTQNPSQAAVDSDELIFLDSGAFGVKHNRDISFFTTTSKRDVKTGVMNYQGNFEKSLGVQNMQLVAAKEYPGMKLASVILRSRVTQLYEVVFFNLTSKVFLAPRMLFNESASHDYCDCEGFLVFISCVSLKLNSTFTVSEMVYNSDSNIVFTNSTHGYGLRNLTNITSIQLTIKSGNMYAHIGIVHPESKVLHSIEFTLYNRTLNRFSYRVLNIEHRNLLIKPHNAGICYYNHFYVTYTNRAEEADMASLEFYAHKNEMFEGTNYNVYYSTLGFKVRELRLKNIKKVFCHGANTNLFSIYGEQSITTGTVTTNHTIIATYEATEKTSRLFNVYNHSVLVNSVTSFDNNKDTVFFDIKEFAVSQYYLIKTVSSYFGLAVGLLPNNNYNVPIQLYNQDSVLNMNLNLNFPSLNILNVVPRSALTYAINKVHQQEELLVSVTGPVMKIELKPLGSNSIKERVTKLRSKATRDASSQHSFDYFQTHNGCSAWYCTSNKTFVFEIEGQFFMTYSTNITIRRFDLAHKVGSFIYLALIMSDGESYILSITVPNKIISYNRIEFRNENGAVVLLLDTIEDFPVIPRLILYPMLAKQDLIMYIESSLGINHCFFKATGLASTDMRILKLYPVPSVNGLTPPCFARTLIEWREGEPISLFICVTASNMHIINYMVHQRVDIDITNEVKPEMHTIPLNQTVTDYVERDFKFQCTFTSRTAFSCFLTKALSVSFIELRLNKVPCNLAFCASIAGSPEEYPVYRTNSIDSMALNLQATYLVLQSSRPSQIVDFTVYKIGVKDAFAGLQTTDTAAQSRMGFLRLSNGSSTLLTYSSMSGVVDEYELGDLQITLRDASPEAMIASLTFSNDETQRAIPLKSLFNGNTVAPPPPPPPASFWSRYWWVAVVLAGLLIAGGLAAGYLMRREKLKKDAFKNDDKLVHNLQEFYF